MEHVFQQLGLDIERVRSEVARQVGLGPEEVTPSTIPYTPRAKRALTLASKEAYAMKRREVSPEHLLLGLLLEGHGVAALVLKSLGVRAERAREEILKAIYPNRSM
jgi:ATP-dependent Clp protease ATP-binding subunit ClpC